MNKLALLLLVLLPLVSCGGSSEEELHGTWTISEETLAEMKKESEDNPMAAALVGGMMKEMSFTFTPDGTFKVSMGASPLGDMSEEGTYEVKKIKGNEFTVESKNGGETQTMVMTIDGDTLTFEEDGKTMTLTRKE